MFEKNTGMIKRGALTAFFESLSDDRMIYVCAPAGYGKTVAVRQWLDSQRRTTAVISLDEYDNKLSHFCEHFCAALRSCQPQNTALAELAEHTSFGSAPEEFTLRAIASLSVKKRVIFVIDDLHFVQEEKVLALLLVFLKRLPESFQIVLVSRNDLPPGFSDLWIKGHLTRVTAEQLRFSSEEIMLLYKKRGKTIARERADDICRFTHGWAIGVNALLLSGDKPSGESLDFLEGFLQSSVWEKWDEATREFMLNTAVMRELNPTLCDFLTGRSDSEILLNRLMHNGAFIFRTNDGLYHYHHLFHGFLKNTLAERGGKYANALLEKEGEWYLSQQDFYSAANCFVLCGNVDGLSTSIDMISLANRGELVIKKLLPLIQNPVYYAATTKRPHHLGLLAWAAFASGRASDMETYADQYYARFPEIVEKTPDRAREIILMSFVDYRVSLSELERAAKTMPILPDTIGPPGSVSMNMPLIHRCARDFSEFAGGDIESSIERMKSLVGWVFGDAISLLSASLAAGLFYEQGQLEKAYAYALDANAEIRDHFAPELKFCATSALIYILEALGQPNEAERVAERAAAMIERDRAYYLNRNLNALMIRRKLWNGNMQAAGDWIKRNESALHEDINFYSIYGAFTLCRAYITCGDYNAAIILLKKVLELAKAYRRPLDIIEAQILLSIAHWKKKRGSQGDAICFLKDAVEMAYPFGYTQIFVNEGAELANMMRRLKGRMEQQSNGGSVPSSFIKMLYLKTLEHQGGGLTSGQPEQTASFTSKQKIVMKLICEGKSYREITDIIGIKLPTLRSHIALIYKKLDVTSETDAIMKIKSLDILN